jgi:3-methylfumaryl-CoA hydratase
VAMLLFEAARRAQPDRRVTAFSFRAMSPFFCGPALRLVRTPDEGSARVYEARTADDALIMTSAVDFAS